MENLKILNNILTENNIYEYGLVNFDIVKTHLIKNYSKKKITEEIKTVIVCIFPYNIGTFSDKNISRYAFSPDYHVIIKDILNNICSKLKKAFPNEKFEAFCDSSPVPEVNAAVKAGLGCVGYNNLLITDKYGSYVFIGEILSTMHFKSENTNKFDKSERCEGCFKCVKICPANALNEKGVFYKDKCLSYITQKKGELLKTEEELIKKNKMVWGCDKCQDICPKNKNAHLTYIKEFYKETVIKIESGEEEYKFKRAFLWRGKDIIKRNLKIINENTDCK